MDAPHPSGPAHQRQPLWRGGTSFFLVTGFHGLHVTGGVIYLLAVLSSVARRPPAASYNMVEIVGLYWHFVDLVWIMVFTFMYLL